jgi:hypothetical protein
VSRFKTAVVAWVLAICFVVGLSLYRGDFRRSAPAPVPAKVEATRHLDKVIACRAREDAERLAVAFNKTTELASALADPRSEAAVVSRRLMIPGRCAHFEHRVSFLPVGMAFDGSTFQPVLAIPYNVIEADVALVEGLGRFYLVTEWRHEPQNQVQPILPL